MKPTKQTVYLPVKDKMPFFTVLEDFEYKTGAEEAKGYFFTPEQLNEYTQSVIKQALETAAENIEFIETTTEKLNSEEYKPFITADDNTVWTIDKQSITNTFEETFKKFEV